MEKKLKQKQNINLTKKIQKYKIGVFCPKDSLGKDICADTSDTSFALELSQSLKIVYPSPAEFGNISNTSFSVQWITSGIDSGPGVPIYIELVGQSGTYRVAQNISNYSYYNLIVLFDVNGVLVPDGRYSIRVCAQASGTSFCDTLNSVLVSGKGQF